MRSLFGRRFASRSVFQTVMAVVLLAAHTFVGASFLPPKHLIHPIRIRTVKTTEHIAFLSDNVSPPSYCRTCCAVFGCKYRGFDMLDISSLPNLIEWLTAPLAVAYAASFIVSQLPKYRDAEWLGRWVTPATIAYAVAFLFTHDPKYRDAVWFAPRKFSMALFVLNLFISGPKSIGLRGQIRSCIPVVCTLADPLFRIPFRESLKSPWLKILTMLFIGGLGFADKFSIPSEGKSEWTEGAVFVIFQLIYWVLPREYIDVAVSTFVAIGYLLTFQLQNSRDKTKSMPFYCVTKDSNDMQL